MFKRKIFKVFSVTIVLAMCMSFGMTAYGAVVKKNVKTSNIYSHNATLSGDYSSLTGAPGSTSITSKDSNYNNKYKSAMVCYYKQIANVLDPSYGDASVNGTTVTVIAQQQGKSGYNVKRHLGYMTDTKTSGGTVVDRYDYYVYSD